MFFFKRTSQERFCDKWTTKPFQKSSFCAVLKNYTLQQDTARISCTSWVSSFVNTCFGFSWKVCWFLFLFASYYFICTCRQSFHYLEQFQSSISNIATAVSLTKLLVVLCEKGRDDDNGMSISLGNETFILRHLNGREVYIVNKFNFLEVF